MSSYVLESLESFKAELKTFLFQEAFECQGTLDDLLVHAPLNVYGAGAT